MQRDSTGLTAENKELKLKLKALEQQAHLRDGMGDFNLYGFLKVATSFMHGLCFCRHNKFFPCMFSGNQI